MKIRKTQQPADYPENQIHDVYSTSASDTYNCNFINGILESLGLKDDTYDSTKTYAVGDMVVKNHTIYECTTAITTAEAWNSSHWTIVPIITN